jgi:hypothetical protein
MNIELISEKEFKNHLIRKLKEIREMTVAGDLLIEGSLVKDPVQKLLVNSNRADWFSSAFLPIIEVAAIDCEKASPGAGKLFLNIIVNLLPDDIRRSMIHKIENKNIKTALNEIDLNATGICTKEDFDAYVKEALSPIAQQIISETLNVYSLGDQIVVKKSLLRETLIEKIVGYDFDNITVNSFFLQNNLWKRNNVNVVIVDGIIESVGEIYHLLEKAHETNEPYLIVCAGILPEPMNVIQHNFARKTIDVIVGQIKTDEFSIHTVVDFGTVCLADPISALKGETISGSILRGTVKVDRIEANGQSVKVINENAKTAAKDLLRDVIERSSNSPDMTFLFQKRVKSLSSSIVNVAIGRDDVDKEKTVIEQVDVFLRCCPSILRQGFIRDQDLLQLDKEIRILLFNETYIQPVDRIKKALECYDSIKEQVNRTGTIVTQQREENVARP